MTIGTRSNCLHRRSCASSQAPRLAGSSRTNPASRSKVPRSRSTDRRPSLKAGIPSSPLGSSQTDAQGRWRLDVAPKDLSELWANLEHPHHMPNGTRVSHDLNSVTVLKKGLTVTGRIVDAAGRPVRGAGVLFGPRSGGRPVRREGRRTSAASSLWRTVNPVRRSSRFRPRASRPESRMCASRRKPHPSKSG